MRGEQPKQRAPLSIDHIRAICATDPGAGSKAIRDRSLLLFGFASALRRSSIRAVDLADVKIDQRGAVVKIHREKQDQTSIGRKLAIPIGREVATCPVRALLKWIEVRGHWDGPLFCSICQGKPIPLRVTGNSISLVVKAAVKTIRLDPGRYGAHSLRAGFVTETLSRGVGEIRVAQQTGHRCLASLRRYYRPNDPFLGNAFGALGL